MNKLPTELPYPQYQAKLAKSLIDCTVLSGASLCSHNKWIIHITISEPDHLLWLDMMARSYPDCGFLPKGPVDCQCVQKNCAPLVLIFGSESVWYSFVGLSLNRPLLHIMIRSYTVIYIQWVFWATVRCDDDYFGWQFGDILGYTVRELLHTYKPTLIFSYHVIFKMILYVIKQRRDALTNRRTV